MTLPETKIYPLYEAVIDGTVLTEENILSFGLNVSEIKLLINSKTLKYEEGKYLFTDVDGLCYYGLRLIALKNRERAIECFKRCLEINPTHKQSALQLFLDSIVRDDLNRAFELFMIMDKSENPYIQANLNYYLYLLSFLISLPEEYNKRARNFQIKNIFVGSVTSRIATLLERERFAALDQDFSTAKDFQYKRLKNKQMKMSVSDIITMNLLCRVVKKRQEIHKSIKNYVKKEKFEHILWQIETSENMHNLSSEYELIRLLTEDILGLFTTGVVRDRNHNTENTTPEITAVLMQDYETTKSFLKDTQVSFSLVEYLLALTDEFYGLKNAEELLLLVSSDFTVNDIRTYLELSDEDYELLLAILAKKCYQNGENTKGDAYIETLERENGRTRKVDFALRNAKANKTLKSSSLNEEKPFIIEPNDK